MGYGYQNWGRGFQRPSSLNPGGQPVQPVIPPGQQQKPSTQADTYNPSTQKPNTLFGAKGDDVKPPVVPPVVAPNDPFRQSVNRQTTTKPPEVKGPPTHQGTELGETATGTDGKQYRWSGSQWILINQVVPPDPIDPVDPVIPPNSLAPTTPGTGQGEIRASTDGTKRYIWWGGRWQETYGEVTGPDAPTTPRTPGDHNQVPPGQDYRAQLTQALDGPIFQGFDQNDLLQLMPWLAQDQGWANATPQQAQAIARANVQSMMNNPNADPNMLRTLLERFGTVGSGAEQSQYAMNMLTNPQSGFFTRATRQQITQMFPFITQDPQYAQYTDEQVRGLVGEYLQSIFRGTNASSKRSAWNWLRQFN